MGVTVNVPADQPTVQAGINAASDGDTVLVAPGTYYENVEFENNNLVLTSHFAFDQDPIYIGQTILNGSTPIFSDSASVIRIVAYQDSTTVIQGFTITGGTGTVWTDPHNTLDYREGGGILCENSSPTIQYNYIVDNEAVERNFPQVSSAGGGGIRAGDGNPHIYNNVIMHNRGLYGGGIVLNYATGVIRNNVIAYNTGGDNYSGSGLWKFAGGAAVVENNTIVGNESPLPGAGVYVSATSMILRNNIIWGNLGPRPVQIVTTLSGSVTVDYCIVENGYAGTDNLAERPLLGGEHFYPTAISPCIDVGDTALASCDPEDPAASGLALWPALGTLRNDMGAYGGPQSFQIDPIAIAADSACGWAPFSTQFEALSEAPIDSWTWDFGDGGTGSGPTVLHDFEIPGVYNVSLAADTSGEPYTEAQFAPVVVLADSLTASSATSRPDSSLVISVFARHVVPLKQLLITVDYTSTEYLTLDSISVAGCRTEYFRDATLLVPDPTKPQFTATLTSSDNNTRPELPPGEGEVLRIHFAVSPLAQAGQIPIILDGYDADEPWFDGSIMGYRPRSSGGLVTIETSCCQGTMGNVDCVGDIDIGDVTELIALLFIRVGDPFCCEDEVDLDYNGDN
jgi:hypothetical protein